MPKPKDFISGERFARMSFDALNHCALLINSLDTLNPIQAAAIPQEVKEQITAARLKLASLPMKRFFEQRMPQFVPNVKLKAVNGKKK